MRNGPSMLGQLKSERGSVLMEFCLMLPIWLLLFGGTFLIFDITMAKMHLQESNRNLAWIQNDRFDKGNKINRELYKRVTRFYDARNALEKSMSGEPIWAFNSGGATPQKQDSDNPQQWGSTNQNFSGNGVELTTGSSWADSIPGLSSVVSGALGNDWSMVCSGNMELRMERVSATYIGAIGVSSVLFPDDENGQETVPLYKSAFTFTRSVSDTKDQNGKAQQSAKLPNGEMLVLRRSGEDDRGSVKDANSLLYQRVIYRSWPSNGSLGDIRLFLGI